MSEPVGSLADVARQHTALPAPAIAHLQRLVTAWGVIADLCFSDLLLFGPLADESGRFVTLAQVRATTGQTLYTDDQVGVIVDTNRRPLVAAAWTTGEVQVGDVDLGAFRVTLDVVPVRCRGVII